RGEPGQERGAPVAGGEPAGQAPPTGLLSHESPPPPGCPAGSTGRILPVPVGPPPQHPATRRRSRGQHYALCTDRDGRTAGAGRRYSTACRPPRTGLLAARRPPRGRGLTLRISLL